MIKKEIDKKEDNLIENFCASCSSGDCTGLIPAGENLTEDEFEAYKEIYPFSVPDMPEKHDKKKNIQK